MNSRLFTGIALSLFAALTVWAFAQSASTTTTFVAAVGEMDDKPKKKEEPKSLYEFTMKDIEGEEVELKEFEDEVLLIVNTASRCGNTPQYAGLEAMYEKYKEQGFSVLAFPANEFGAQEPGTDEEIKAFCETNYGVTFPLFSKIVVKGEGIHPLYRYLTEQLDNEELIGEIEWNFTKFLVSRDGKVIDRFMHRMKPEEEELVAKVESALAVPRKKKPAEAEMD